MRRRRGFLAVVVAVAAGCSSTSGAAAQGPALADVLRVFVAAGPASFTGTLTVTTDDAAIEEALAESLANSGSSLVGGGGGDAVLDVDGSIDPASGDLRWELRAGGSLLRAAATVDGQTWIFDAEPSPGTPADVWVGSSDPAPPLATATSVDPVQALSAFADTPVVWVGDGRGRRRGLTEFDVGTAVRDQMRAAGMDEDDVNMGTADLLLTAELVIDEDDLLTGLTATVSNAFQRLVLDVTYDHAADVVVEPPPQAERITQRQAALARELGGGLEGVEPWPTGTRPAGLLSAEFAELSFPDGLEVASLQRHSGTVTVVATIPAVDSYSAALRVEAFLRIALVDSGLVTHRSGEGRDPSRVLFDTTSSPPDDVGRDLRVVYQWTAAGGASLRLTDGPSGDG